MSAGKSSTLGSRLKHARIKSGYASAAAACERFGWALSKYRAHENGQNQYKVKDAEIYAKAYGVTPAWLLTGGSDIFRETNVNSIIPVAKAKSNIQNGGYAVPLVAIICVGLWREGFLSQEPESEVNTDHFTPNDPRYPNEHQFDVRIQGNSFNKYASDGSYLRCVNLVALNSDIQDGDFVVIQREKENLVEFSAKRVKKNGNGIELLNETLDPRLKEQVIMLDDDTANIKIIGKILWTYKNLENL